MYYTIPALASSIYKYTVVIIISFRLTAQISNKVAQIYSPFFLRVVLTIYPLRCYNNCVIDNDIIDYVGGRNMANRDHSLDDGIIRAAYEEFLAHGFQNASLHKIAEKAGVTTGAIYTRYKNKDALFVSLLSGFIDKLGEIFTPAAAEYEKAGQIGTTEALLNAINYEERIYFRLLSDYYDECTLFFSRSDGSSVEKMVSRLMDTKTEQTVEFFTGVYGKAPNADAVRLIMGAQFWYFRQLLNERHDEERVISCLHALLDFSNAGWSQLCDSLK